MATRKRRTTTGSKSAKSRMRRQALAAAAVGVAAGVATLAVAKGLETPRGRALKRKALTKGKRVGRNVLADVERAAVASAMDNMKRGKAGAGPMSSAKPATKSTARKPASRAR